MFQEARQNQIKMSIVAEANPLQVLTGGAAAFNGVLVKLARVFPGCFAVRALPREYSHDLDLLLGYCTCQPPLTGAMSFIFEAHGVADDFVELVAVPNMNRWLSSEGSTAFAAMGRSHFHDCISEVLALTTSGLLTEAPASAVAAEVVQEEFEKLQRIQVRIRLFNGHRTFKVWKNTLVSHLIEHVAQLTSLPSSSFCLTFNGKHPHEECMIGELGVTRCRCSWLLARSPKLPRHHVT